MKDSWLDRALHRRLSRPLSAAAIRAGVRPNVVTLASLAFGLGAAWFVSRASVDGAALGLSLYLVSVVFDHADGEVARATGAASRFGHWLDLAADTAVHAALAVAMGMAASRLGVEGWLLGLCGAGGIVASAAAVSAWPLESNQRESARWAARLLGGLENRQGFYGALLGFVLIRAIVPEWLPVLLLVVALGSQAYWLTRAILGLRGRGSPRRAAAIFAAVAGRRDAFDRRARRRPRTRSLDRGDAS